MATVAWIARQRTAKRASLTVRIGSWSAVLATIGAIGFAIGIVVNIVLLPGPAWTGDIGAYAAKYSSLGMAVTVVPSLLIVPAFVALVASLHGVAREERRPMLLLALVFAAVYAATVGTNYFLQLIVVRQNLEAGTTEGMALLAMPNPHSIFWAFEFMGYFWQGLAAGLVALAMSGGRLQWWIRWLFASVSFAGAVGIIASIVGVSSFTDPLMIVGTAPWLIAFPTATALCAAYFNRLARGETA
jgi:hypothetical protein